MFILEIPPQYFQYPRQLTQIDTLLLKHKVHLRVWLRLLQWSFVWFSTITSVTVLAKESVAVDELVRHALDKKLYQADYWQSLLHYQPGFFGGFESQADDPAFFLAAQGKVDPIAELVATIKAVFSSVPVTNEHARCHFIARHHWLSEQLNLEQSDTTGCSAYREWLNTINPYSVSLVFPASYLNSPSSMFGHTLLRIEPNDFRRELPLANFALNYAADVNNIDNEILFAYKGIFGGYPGKIHIVPYHEKIKEYNDLENRDIWEYQLNLSPFEVVNMMRHVWELKDIEFDYFFMTENCSYRLMSLLDVARPGLSLTRKFSLKAIPVDTVRAVFSAGLVEKSHFRASQSKQLLSRFDLLSESMQEQVKLVADSSITTEDKLVSSYSGVDRARIYELAFDYLRYQAKDDLSVRHPNYKKSYSLLTKRSRLKQAALWPEVADPPIRLDQTHFSSRVAVGTGRYRGDDLLSFKIKPAYHDRLDPTPGFEQGAEINFFDLDLQWIPRQSSLQLHRFTLLNIVSLSASNKLISPISWLVDGRVQRQNIDGNTANLAELSFAAGKTYPLTTSQQLALLMEGQLIAHQRLRENYALGAGPHGIYLVRWAEMSGFAAWSWQRFFAGHALTRRHSELGLAYRLQQNHSLRLSWQRHDWASQSDRLLELGLHIYF